MYAQIAIMIFGASAIYLVSLNNEYKRWGYIMGMLGQPFWFYITIKYEQWGILVMTLFYTYSWGNGIWNYWIKEYQKKNVINNKKEKNNCHICSNGVKNTDFAYQYDLCVCPKDK